MPSRLYAFCFLENTARRKAYGIAIATAFMYSLVMGAVANRPRVNVIPETLIVLLLVYIGLAYTYIRNTAAKKTEWLQGSAALFRRGYALSCLLSFMFVFGTLQTNTLQAWFADQLFQRLSAASAQELSEHDIRTTTEVAEMALNSEAVVRSPDAVREVGEKLLKVQGDNQDVAWDGVISVAEYRSFLDHQIEPFTPPAEWAAHFYQSSLAANNTGQLLHLMRGAKSQWLLSYINLDGWILEDMLIVDSTVRYRGGPLSLRNVHFVRCKFEIDDTPRGRKLAARLIQSNSPNFPIEQTGTTF